LLDSAKTFSVCIVILISGVSSCAGHAHRWNGFWFQLWGWRAN